MTITFRKSFPLLLLLTFTLGCQLVNQIQKKVEEDQKPKVLTSTDGKCQLTVPGNWTVLKDMNEDATIHAGNLRAEQYAIVISETKEDFTSGMALGDVAEVVKKEARKLIVDPIMSESWSVSVNGYPAIQFEAEGSMNNIKARWLYTVVDAPKNYHQIMTWSLRSKYGANKPVFRDVIDSFKEIEGLRQPPPPIKKTN